MGVSQVPQYAAALDLTSLNGANGFRVDGADAGDLSGFTADAGDFNGDGFDDLILGASGGDPGARENAGETYVVFGRAAGFLASVDLGDLDGHSGVRVDGADPFDYSGRGVASAGDVNGDGFDDFIIGASEATAGGGTAAGETYVVFGRGAPWPAAFDLAALNGGDGFRLDGIDAEDLSGRAVATAGDVNGDGFDDIVIGAANGDPGGDANAGEVYVVFGKASAWPATLGLSTLNGTNGFRLDGVQPGDAAGFSVASAGDVNGDGFSDLLIGAYAADPSGRDQAGTTYVVFGKAAGFAAAIDLAALDGTNGFRLVGAAAGDKSGRSVASAGDVNADGFADFLIGAPGADPGGAHAAGSAYIIFGKASGFAATVDLGILNGSNGFRLDGADAANYSAQSVSGAGDVNGDGFDDVLIGAPGAAEFQGETYVVFGKASGFSAALSLASLDGNSGFRLDGAAQIGRTVASAGDVNGDGFDDVTVGAYSGEAGSYAGTTYVIFGARPLEAVTRFGTAIANRINGGDLNDVLFGVGGDDSLYGHEGADAIYGGQGADDAFGGGGFDVLVLSIGTDRGEGGAGDDYIYAGDGNDVALGDSGVDVLIGEAGADTLSGGVDQDYLFGGSENDALIGDAGVDVLHGEAGDDVSSGGDGIDYFYAESGNDIAFGGADGDILVMQGGNDQAFGQAGNDFAYGGADSDTIFGGAGTDVLLGEAGDDTVDGGQDVDYVFLGTGDDTFVMDAATPGLNVDVLHEFTPGAGSGDVLRLLNTGWTTIAEVNAAMVNTGNGYSILYLDGDTNIWLIGVLPGQLVAGDVAFS